MIKQGIFTIITVIVAVGLITIIVLGSYSKKNISSSQLSKGASISNSFPSNIKETVFFYGNTCPHCKDVEDWMNKNKIEQKIKINKKEVYDNKTNAQELLSTAKNCGLDTNMIGVPFLYAEGKCYIGTPDVINYLSKKVGL